MTSQRLLKVTQIPSVWVFSSFTTSSDGCALSCFTVRITKRCVRRTQRAELDARGRSLLLTACVWVRTPCAPDPSVSQIRVCGYDAWKLNFFDDCRFMGMLYLSHLKGQAAGEGEWGLSHGVLHNLYLVRVPESASLHPKGEGSDLKSNESCIYLGLEEE